MFLLRSLRAVPRQTGLRPFILQRRFHDLAVTSIQKGENNKSPDVPYAVYENLFTEYKAALDKIISKERKQTRLEMIYAALYDDKLRAEDCYNLRGGLEQLAAVAASTGRIPSISKSTSARLKEITQLPEFKTALAKLSLRVHGNTSQMTISAEEFCPLEVGALLCFFETQNHWPDPLPFTLLPNESNELGKQLKVKHTEE
ncbi:hypothetical protein BDD12DRAFT_912555 [Trichophaea hybrida]|nr:hypothetical protein BDD12DRAFT_912555 [Trichophaea hybrida]